MEYIDKSSTIEAVSYAKVGKRLTIHFKTGAVYEWTGVPMTKYKRLLEAKSKGKYFSKEIRGRYVSEKIKDKEQIYNDLKDFFEI